MKDSKKVVFAGPVGVGKSTAVQLLGGSHTISTDEKASDITSKYKSRTTVAMDYGLVTLSNGEQVRLYGTPGQERFDFMWDIIMPNSSGLILLIDNSRSSPLQDLRFFACKFKEYFPQEKIVVGITKSDIQNVTNIEQYRGELSRLGINSTVHIVDARNKNDMMNLLLDALSLFSDDYLAHPQTSSINW